MRTDTQLWREKNLATSKDPRYTIELAFDEANTILAYFTSHTDCATPGGGTLISGVVEGISGTSQGLDPDKGVATIGAISFRVIDKASAVTTQLGNQITLGRSTRQQRVRVYMGFEGLAFADYTLVATQIVDDIGFDDGVYTFRCADIQRAMRKDIFDLATTTLAASISDTDTTVQVYDTSKFAMLAHGTSYSDAPSSTVGYFKLDDEAIRYTGKTATTFTGCTRGVLNTRAAAHVIDPGASADRQPKVEEYVYLEMPAPKLAYALLTGVLHGQGGATLPSGWHLGISIDYAKLADFTGIGADLWDTADDDEGFVVYFEALAKQDGKQFIEKELMVLMGTYMPVYNDGRLGLRRMANILAGAAYVQLLDESNVVSHGELQHDFKSLHNQIQIDWNYEPAEKRFTRTTALIDQDSITIHKAGEPLKLAFRGLHGSRHSATILKQRFDALRDRYTGPPLRMTEKALPSLNAIEVGDVVRNKLSTVRDFVANGTLDRSFEVQKISIDWVRGDVSLTLFASSQAPGAIAPTADASVLPQSWYEARGTALSTALTITGSNPGHISANGNLVAGDYYYIGDLVLDAGVTVTLNGTVRLFVMGHLTINGDFDGKGRGLAGAAQVAAFANPYINETRADYATRIGSHNDGTVGYLGSPRSGGGIVLSGRVRPLYDGYLTQGANPTVPSFAIAWDGAALSGLPADLRGSSGATGHNSSIATSGYDESFGSQYSSISYARGGAGGAGGAGLVTVTRGVSFGGSGGIDLSGADGTLGEHVDYFTRLLYAGAGAGGAPGGWLCVLDGALANVPSLGVTFVADYGRAPIAGNLVTKSIKVGNLPDGASVSHLVGNGDGTTFPLPSLSGARGGARIQFVPANVAAEADAPALTLTPPSSLTLASGTAELLLNSDGTVVPRIKLTWSASPDTRTLVYEIQFKPSSASVWQDAPAVLGINSTTTWISGVRDGIAYDVRIRAAGDLRRVSPWLPVLAHTVAGKTAPPANVTGFSASQNSNVVTFQWNQVTDVDLAGYEIRFGPQAIATWADGSVLTSVTRGTRVTSAAVPPGTWRMMIKARDTSGNYSATETGFNLTVANELDVISQRQQAPDWLGTKTNFYVHWTGVLVPDSTMLASAMTDVELWDTFVHSPYATCTYEAPEIDIGFDDTARIWGSIESALGPGVTAGIADPDLEVDYRLAADAYDGFEPWTIGDRTGRYFKHRLVLNTAEGNAKITGFLPTVDQLEFVQSEQVMVAAGGSTITFPQQFHVAPQVTATAVGSTALFPVLDAITAQSFFVRVFDAAGANVGGTIVYNAKGV